MIKLCQLHSIWVDITFSLVEITHIFITMRLIGDVFVHRGSVSNFSYFGVLQSLYNVGDEALKSTVTPCFIFDIQCFDPVFLFQCSWKKKDSENCFLNNSEQRMFRPSRDFHICIDNILSTNKVLKDNKYTGFCGNFLLSFSASDTQNGQTLIYIIYPTISLLYEKLKDSCWSKLCADSKVWRDRRGLREILLRT